MKEEKAFSHFLISGRRCGWAEDTTGYVSVPEEENPETVFIRDILYAGSLPDDWEDRSPTYEENSYGEWAFINGCIELPFGVALPEEKSCALVLEDFRMNGNTFSADTKCPLDYFSV
jgi:hypothetical protein